MQGCYIVIYSQGWLAGSPLDQEKSVPRFTHLQNGNIITTQRQPTRIK